jgi:hypothetical protein
VVSFPPRSIDRELILSLGRRFPCCLREEHTVLAGWAARYAKCWRRRVAGTGMRNGHSGRVFQHRGHQQ